MADAKAEAEAEAAEVAEATEAAAAEVAAEDITAYVDKVSDEPLLAQEPAGGKVVKTKEAKYGYKQLTLSNGATVYLKSTDFKAGEKTNLNDFLRTGMDAFNNKNTK